MCLSTIMRRRTKRHSSRLNGTETLANIQLQSKTHAKKSQVARPPDTILNHMDHECIYMCGATDNQSGSVPPHGRPSEDIRTPPPTSRSSRSFHVYIRIRNKHTYTQGSLRAMARTAHTSTHAAWRHAPQIIHPEPHQNPPFLLPPAIDPLATLCIHPELWKLALDTIQCNGKSSNEIHNVPGNNAQLCNRHQEIDHIFATCVREMVASLTQKGSASPLTTVCTRIRVATVILVSADGTALGRLARTRPPLASGSARRINTMNKV